MHRASIDESGGRPKRPQGDVGREQGAARSSTVPLLSVCCGSTGRGARGGRRDLMGRLSQALDEVQRSGPEGLALDRVSVQEVGRGAGIVVLYSDEAVTIQDIDLADGLPRDVTLGGDRP